MSINSNETKLINTLLQRTYTISELVLEMEVSQRHIHNYISNINYYIDQAISIQKGIVKLEISGAQWAQKVREIPLAHYRPFSYERQDYLLNNYLFLKQGNYQKIEKQLGISRPTLKKDLSKLSSRLQLNGLSIQYSDGRFLITGTEKKLRHLMMEQVNKQIIGIHPNIEYCTAVTPLQHHTQVIIARLFSVLPLKKIHMIITKISHTITDKFPAHFIKLMFTYLSISLHRINQNFYILQKNNADYLRKTAKFKLVYNQLRLLINDKLEFEHLHLTEYFFSGCTDNDFHEYQLQIEMCVTLFLHHVEQRVPLSKAKKYMLHVQLCNYLPSAIYRIKNNIHLQIERSDDVNKLDKYQSLALAIFYYHYWLPEPLRDEELHQVHLFIEHIKESDEPNKISLDDLLNTLQNYTKGIADKPLKKALLNKYPMLFSDDTQLDYLYPCRFCVTDIHLLNSQVSLTKIIELGALHLTNKLNICCQKSQHPLVKLITPFINYLYIGSNVHLYSTSSTQSIPVSTLQVILQTNNVYNQVSNVYYFFWVHNESFTSPDILFALYQFEQHKHIYENTINSKYDWIVELLNQYLIVTKSI